MQLFGYFDILGSMEQNNVQVQRQRVVRTEEQILNLLEEFEKSGFTAKEFCEVSEIHEATFYSWQRKYPKEGSDVKGFTTIEVVPAREYAGPELFAEAGNIRLYKQVSAEYQKALMS
jgi:hypothetical protein